MGDNFNSSTIINSFAIGSVSGSSDVGGLIGYDDGTNTLTNNWWYNSLSQGIGNNGSNISLGQWQEAGSIADFYTPANPVYAIGTEGEWDIFTSVWDTYTNELPHLHWEYHAGSLNPIWLGTSSSDFDTASNWSDDSVPGIDSTAIIVNASNEPTLSATTTLADLLIGSGTFTQNGALTLTGSYAQAGGTYNQNADLSIGGNFTQGGGSFISDPTKTFTVGNSFSLNGGTFSRFTGLGTGIDPYLIYDVYGLQAMEEYLSSIFGLANDIDASSTSNWNYGAGFTPIGTFTGTFDGNNYTISNLFINLPTTNDVGLFGYTSGATIENAGLLNVNITGQNNVGGLVGLENLSSIDNSYVTGSVSGSNSTGVGGLVGCNGNGGSIANSYANVNVSGGANYVGGLIGWNTSGIDNSYSTGNVSGSYYVGGLVGANYGSIANSYATGSISGSYAIGGLIGYNGNSSIDNSYANGSVSGNNAVGGLVGNNRSGSIANSYATGSVIGNANEVGGLVGYNVSSSNIDNSYATGNVSGASYTGGLVGWNVNSSSISNSYATGSVSGSDTVGGLVGFNFESSINNSYATGTVSGSSATVGGLVGVNTNSSSIDNSYATGSVSGSGNRVGGLAGENANSSSITNSYATGSVSSGGNNVGGLVGLNGSSSITNSYATGSVSGGGQVGGLVGVNGYSSSIDNSYATGSVRGSLEVGGLVGQNNNSGSIDNSYATGSVSGIGRDVGGLVGENYTSSSIDNSYATGSVSGGSDVGGLIGVDDGSNTLTNNWWYNSLSNGIGNYGPNTSSGHWQEAGSASDFYSSSQAVYSTWDFKGLWKDSAGVTYPTLIWQGMNNGSFIGGTASIPFLIHNVNQLQFMGYALSDSFQLASDIDASATSGWDSDTGFTPVGNSTTPFTGTFNGDNFTISDLFISLPSTDYVGLFGETSGATIENVGLLNVNITGQNNVGSLVGENYNSSSIDNSYATGNISGSGYSVGGLVGGNYNSSSIDNSYATGTVSGNYYIGGLVGINQNSSNIASSYATGSVSGGGQVGGLVGFNINSSIADSYATGNVSGSVQVGGLVGSNWNSSIANSYATGNVIGSGNDVGGLVGSNETYSSIANSYATGSVIGSGNDVGGLVGYNGYFLGSGSIDNSYASGNVSGNSDVGGLVGSNVNSSSITNSYAVGNVSGSTSVGGLIGDDDSSNTLTNNWWYNSLNNGIGNYGPNTSIGHWQEAGSVADFYSPANPVYAVGTLGGWDFFTPIWDSYTDELPHLAWENHSGNFTPYWLGTISSDFDLASNWSNDVVPGIGSTAIILSGANEPILSANTTLANLLMGSGTFTQDAALTLSGNYAQGGGTYDQNANLAIGGNFSQSDGAFVSDPTKTFSVGNSFSLSSGTFNRFTGLGTGSDPYFVYDVFGLQGMGGFLSSNFGLHNNIDASSTSNWNSSAGFVPIGNSSTPFTGTFNGNNFTISDLFINLPTTNNVGLFGETSGATIENVGLLNASITGQNYVGALVGANQYSSIVNSYASGNVIGSGSDIGGLVGYNNSSNITYSYSTGSVSGSGNDIGGFVGYNNFSSNIDNSYANGGVSGGGYYVGGLVGYNNSSITNSYATGSVSGSLGVGGLVGQNDNASSINNSYATGSVSGSNYVGGLVGINNFSRIDNSYATGSVNGDISVGGLVGYNEASSNINNSYSTGSVSGSSDVGGLVGISNSSNISNSYTTGNVSGSGNHIGGLVGYNDGASIDNSYYTDSNHQNGHGIFDPNGASDFYSPLNPVYAIGTAGEWDIFTPIWDTYTDELPHLHWENHSGSLNPLWLGTSSSDFDTASNWSTNSVPGSSSTAIIASGTNEPNLNATTTLADLLIGSGIFTQDGALTLTGNFVQAGGTYNQNANLSIGSNFTQGGGAFNSDPTKTFTVGNSFALSGGTFSRFTGLGTSLDPYLIYDVYGLQGMGGFLSSTFGLANNIDASSTSNWNSGAGFTPIGNSSTSFTGAFNGNSYTISNLIINLPSSSGVGLFGYIHSATIENVGILNVNITGQDLIGGLIGYNRYSSSIDNSYATGSVSGSGFYVGGLVGLNSSSSSIANSYATDIVSGNYYVGGLVGYNRDSSSIDNSYSTGNVSGNNGIGGLVGYNVSTSNIANSYSTGNVSGSNRIGGLVGYNSFTSSIDNSYASGSVSGSNGGYGIGGFVGGNYNSSRIDNSYATGSVSGNGSDGVGGFVGYNHSSSSIDNSYATGSVNGGSGSYGVGGLVGYNNSSNIANSYATGRVIGSGAVGGLVGGIYNSSSIDNSYATGSVSGSSNIGGLVGYNRFSSSIDNSYATGSVSGSSNIGGLVGYNDGSSSIDNSYAVGLVTGTTNVGGFVGDDGGGSYTTNFFDHTVNSSLTGTGNNGNVSGISAESTASMQTESTFAGVGWDFNGLWAINSYEYPHLLWQDMGDGSAFIGGTSLHPFRISDVNELQFMSYDLSSYFELTGDIDASETTSWNSGEGFTPVGNSSTPFTGIFNGNNYTISNLFIDRPSTNYVGLFGYTSGAAIENVGLLNDNITGQSEVGGLVGDNYGSSSIDNSYATGSVSGSGENIGGLVGYNRNSSSIDNSYATGNVIGGSDSYYVGGLVGDNYISSSIANSYATGNVSGYYSVGGLAGYSGHSTSIDNSYATGSVSGSECVGGLVGEIESENSISNSYSTGNVSGGSDSYYVGGLVGYNYYSSISNSYATGSVSGGSDSYYVGGLVGYNYGSSNITNSFAVGSVSGSTDVGGLIGYDDGSNTLTNNWWNNSLDNGIGNNGSNTSVGHWQEAGSVADFYSPANPVYAVGTPGGWDIFTPIWDTYTDELPHLHWEHHSGNLTPYWLGTTSIDFDTASNWSDDLVPGIDSTVIIYNGINEPTLSTTTTLANLFMSSGTFTQDGVLTLSGNYAQGGGTFDQNANLSIVGNFSQNSGAFVSNPANTFTVGNSFSLSGGTFSRFTGLGTGLDPYLIYDVYGLQGMGGFLSNTFGLGHNVDASVTLNWNSGAGFTPVGNSSTPFTGTFNGDNYTISNLFINLPTMNNVGLFGETSGATIENVGLLNANITGQTNVGSLVGYSNNSSRIDNSYATGSVSGSLYYIGGLVGYNDHSSSIDNSYATSSVSDGSGGWEVGGLVGGNYNSSSIDNSYATGSVSGRGGVGGLVGDNNNSSSITNSYATGSVSGDSGGYGVGGLVGGNYNSSSIDNSYATGSVSGTYGVGGLVGDNWRSSISNSYATGSVSGFSSGNGIGGLAGYNGNSSKIDNSYATGSVSGGGNGVGGLVGGNYSSSSIDNSYATGSVSGINKAGGLVGYNITSSSIDNSYATGFVSGSTNLGGLVGYDNGGTYSANFFNHTVNSSLAGTGNNGNVSGISGESTANMQTESTYTGAGWDFNGLWAINTNEYPHLLWQDMGDGSAFIGGSSLHPFQISDVNELQFMSYDLSSYFKLTGDIDASTTSSWNSDAGFTPVGNSSTPFTGTFNGNNYTISDLFISLPTTNGVGLFGYTSGATIENVGLLNANIMGQSGVGALVGYNTNSSSIDNSYATGSVSGGSGSDYVGGLVGVNDSSISNSYATGNVSGGSGSGYVGGLVGVNDSSISNSYATGSVSGNYYIGGLVGSNPFSSISNSYATGSVSGSGEYVGGLVGVNYHGSIDNSYATGSVSGSGEYVGGLVGYNYLSNITNSYATGSVNGSANNVGGLVGFNNSSSIANSYASGRVSGSSNVGGFVGGNYNSSSIDNSYVTGSVSGSSNVGGLIGYDDGSNTLTNNWWYNSLINGIGSNGPNVSVGHWQEANSTSDFFNQVQAVYNGTNPWDFINTWVATGLTYPDLLFTYDIWSGSGSWSNASNWSKDIVPTQTSKVLFNATSLNDSTIDAFGGDIASLVITSGYTGSIAQNNDLTITGSYVQGGGTFNQNTNLSINGSYVNNGGTFNAGSQPVTFTGSGTINSGSTLFNNLNVNASGTYTLADALSVNDNLNIQAGELDANGQMDMVTGLTTISGGTYSASTATQIFSGGLTVSGGIFTGAGGDVSTTDLTLSSGTLTAPSGEFNVSGAWDRIGGTFDPGTYTVTLDGTAQSISGNTTFYNLTKTVSSADTLTFEAGSTQTIEHTLTLQGASGDLLSLRSSSNGTAWNIDPQGTKNIGDVDAKDSDNINATVISPHTSIDLGNNTNWSFGYLAMTGTSPMTAGTTDDLVITSYDDYGAVNTSYAGAKGLTFSGLSDAITGQIPTVAGVDIGSLTDVDFTAGVSNNGAATLKAYKAETASVGVTNGNLNATGHTLSLTVNPASANSLTLSAVTTTPNAGSTDQLTLTAYDLYDNIATGYTGAESGYIFSGANSISSYIPTVTDNSGTPVDFGIPETLTFNNGVSSLGGDMTLYKAETASVTATQGSLTSNALGITVAPLNVSSLTLSAASTTPVTGSTDQLTITAKDVYGNTATSYTGDEANFTFSGANSIGLYVPTVTDKTGTAIDFGTPETLAFLNGVSSAGGLMTLYDVETALVTATQGSLTSNALSVTVTPPIPLPVALINQFTQLEDNDQASSNGSKTNNDEGGINSWIIVHPLKTPDIFISGLPYQNQKENLIFSAYTHDSHILQAGQAIEVQDAVELVPYGSEMPNFNLIMPISLRNDRNVLQVSQADEEIKGHDT